MKKGEDCLKNKEIKVISGSVKLNPENLTRTPKIEIWDDEGNLKSRFIYTDNKGCFKAREIQNIETSEKLTFKEKLVLKGSGML